MNVTKIGTKESRIPYYGKGYSQKNCAEQPKALFLMLL